MPVGPFDRAFILLSVLSMGVITSKQREKTGTVNPNCSRGNVPKSSYPRLSLAPPPRLDIAFLSTPLGTHSFSGSTLKEGSAWKAKN